MKNRLVLPVFILILFFIFPIFSFANPFISDTNSSSPQAVATTGTPQALVTTQLSVRDRIAQALNSFKTDKSPVTIAIIIIGSFVYGILHGAGPGHRKTILFSLFLARKAKPLEPLVAGSLSAGLHAASAVVLIGILSVLNGAVAGITKIDLTSTFMEGLSFTVVFLLAVFLVVRKLVRWLIKRNRTFDGPAEEKAGPLRGPQSGYGIVIVSSIVPCPGATMILIFALYLHMVLLGIVAIISMSLGMALVISAAAYLAYFGREGVFGRLKSHQRLIRVLTDLLELISYLFMAAFSLYTAWPFLLSLLYA